MARARFIVFDEIATIVMTANPDANGLYNQRQNGLYITDRITVKVCEKFLIDYGKRLSFNKFTSILVLFL